MINKSKEMVINAIHKVINSAPTINTPANYNYNNYFNYYMNNTRNDISKQEFDTWINYAYQVLDISYNHIGLNCILATKNTILKLVNQFNQLRTPYMQRVLEICRELFNLVQMILQY